MNNLINILLVEDDDSLNRGISFKLKKEKFNVFSAKSIEEGKKIFNENSIDLILLDIGLPDGDGFQFCKDVKKIRDVLIIFLTACVQEVDIVKGYDLGADDYVTKPFSLMVLISKINAVLRRREKRGAEKIRCKDIIYYPGNMKIFVDGEEVFLTKTELKLFKCFIDHPHQVIIKEQFFNEIWDGDGNFLNESTLPTNIRRLREKIEQNPSEPQYIKTVRGLGYIWAEECFKE
ncbi:MULTISPECIES: response regulator transcription factor [Tissierellales]|jgi:DNA-binding response OmpR family regulator|uniref:Response regulator transcription factor n=1 Tax=Acidilutibacter cellobiosedens TaxID=2507161 RepID=A0A410QE96_9FIRM|nr:MULTISPECIES: response regulator transcription factor [Tissierellales]QAT62310.1 response regulator transcription factor [Acidilutibacter cellobiosedens]SCL92177.1 Transcriptional regulatory protein WalR [Sporanaerobacter sp. PP17-6a]